MGATRPGEYRRRVVRGALSTGAANAWSMLLVLGSLPVVLAGLGSEAFGLWVLLQTFSAVTGWFALADLGVGVATTRRVAEHLSVDDAPGATRVIGSSLVVFVTVGIGAMLLLAVVGRTYFVEWFNVPEGLVSSLRTATLLYAIQVGFEVVIEGIEASLEGLQRVDLSRLADSTRFTAVTVATVVAAATAGTLAAVAAVSLVLTVLSTAFAAFLLLRHRPGRHGMAPAGEHVVGLLRYGRTVGVLNATGVAHRTMDRFIVGVILGPASVTLVEIATQIQNGANAVLSATAYTATSAAPWLRARDAAHELNELLLRGTRYSMLATMPFIVLSAVLVGPLVDVWLGPQYETVADLTRVALCYLLVAAPLGVGSNILVGMGHARLVLVPAAIAVIVNLVASVILVHEIGVVGAFVGTLAGALVITPLLLRAVLRQTGTRLSDFARTSLAPSVLPTAGAALAAASALLLPNRWAQLVVGGVAGVVAYAAIAVRTSLHRDEVEELRALVRRG